MKMPKTKVLFIFLVSIALILSFAGFIYAAESHSGGHSSTGQASPSVPVNQNSSTPHSSSNPEPAQTPQRGNEMQMEDHSNMPGMSDSQMTKNGGSDMNPEESHGDSGEESVSDEVNWYVVGSFLLINLLIIAAAAISKRQMKVLTEVK